MKIFKSAIFASLLLTSSAYADGFGINLGPFSLQLDASTDDYYVTNRTFVDTPICSAISNLRQLEVTVEGAENVSSKERKIVTKRIILEPYAFGVTGTGKPVLQGNVVSEKIVKEVSVKYGDDKFDEKVVPLKSNGYFYGLFSSNGTNIDIRQVVDIHVIEGSHFTPPSHFKGMSESNVKVICQLPITN